MKKMSVLIVFLSVFVIGIVGANAFSVTWVPESKDYAVNETFGSGSLKVLEYKDAMDGASNGWVTSPNTGGETRSNGSTVLFSYYPDRFAYVQTTVASTAVAFMLESDANDYYVNFYVDEIMVLGNYYMQDLPKSITAHDGDPNLKLGTLVVSGLCATETSFTL